MILSGASNTYRLAPAGFLDFFFHSLPISQDSSPVVLKELSLKHQCQHHLGLFEIQIIIPDLLIWKLRGGKTKLGFSKLSWGF